MDFNIFNVYSNRISVAKKQAFKMNKPVKIGENNTAGVNTISYDPEGKTLAVGFYDGSLKAFSPITGK